MGITGYLACLVATIIIELAAYRFILKRREQYLDICVINVATNPSANALLMSIPLLANRWLALAIVEALVVISEWIMLAVLRIRRPFLVSVVINGCSGLAGLILMLMY